MTARACTCRHCTSNATLHAALAEHGITSREHPGNGRMWVRAGVDLCAMTAQQGWDWLHDGAPADVAAWRSNRKG